MRCATRATLAWLALSLLACGDDRSPADSGRADTGAPMNDASTDGAIAADGGADAQTQSLDHFATCTADAECPAGDTCTAPTPDDPSTADPDRPRQCRPPCATSIDCVASLAPLTTEAFCHDDGFCLGYCAPVSPFIAPCNEPYVCHRFVAGGRDGYCGEP
jgi:hypothetical protein